MRQRGEPRSELHLALAALYARVPDRARVYRHLQAARKLGVVAARTDIVLAMLFRREERFDAALSVLVRLLVDNPRHPYAAVQLWKTFYTAQLSGARLKTDVDAIRDRLAAFGMQLPARPATGTGAANQSRKLTASGYNALLANRSAFAAELFQAAIDSLPSNARAHRGLGIARVRLEDYPRAVGAYLLYLELKPDAHDADRVDRVLMRHWKRLALQR